jgi:hypothetical protein
MKKGKSMAGAIVIVIALAVAGIYFYTAEGDVTNSGFGYWEQKIFVEYTPAEGGGLEELSMFQQMFGVFHNGKEVASIHYVLSATKTSAATQTVLSFNSYIVSFVTGVNPSVTYNAQAWSPSTKTLSVNNVKQQLYDIEIPISNIVDSLPDGQYNMVVTPAGSVTFTEDGGIGQSAVLPGSLVKALDIQTPIQQHTFVWTASPSIGGYVTPTSGGQHTGSLEIQAHANTGYVFSHWTGTPWTGQQTQNPITIQMTQDQTVVAYFTQTTPGEGEDLSTYYEYDDGNYQELTPNVYSITATNMPRISSAYFQKVRPIGTTDFIWHFQLTPTELEQSAGAPLPVGGTLTSMLVNGIGTNTNTEASNYNDGIVFSCRAYHGSAVTALYMQIRTETDPISSHREIEINLGSVYDVTIARTWDFTRGGGVVTMDVYEDGVHVPSYQGGTPTITLDYLVDPTYNTEGVPAGIYLDRTNVQYFIPSCGRGGGGNDALQSGGTFQNFEFTVG